MVIIPLSPTYTSFVITIISVVAELLCLSAFLTFNNLAECAILLRGSLISIRRHQFRIIFVTLIAMVLFVTVETLTSIYSNTDFAVVSQTAPCVRTTTPGLRGAVQLGAEVLLFTCVKINGSTFTFFGGNFSTSLGRTTCSDEFLFRYQVGNFVNQTIAGDGIRRCIPSLFGDICAILRTQGRTVFLSEPFQKPPPGANEQIPWLFLRTEINFNPALHLDLLMNKTMQAHTDDLLDEWDIRRRVFAGSENSTCEFTSQGKERTNIKTAIVTLTVILWIVSAILFISSLLFKRNSFYNISNPLDWANNTFRAMDNHETSVTHVRCVVEDGSRRVYATDAEGSRRYISEL